MPQLTHFSLEPYRQRYTEFLRDWEAAAFRQAGFDYFRVEHSAASHQHAVPLNIRTGEVLDSVVRPVCCFEQWLEFFKMAPVHDSIYFSDFFTPGIEALPYSRIKHGKVGAFLWAQSFDQFDFTRNFIEWMRPYEVMAFEIFTHVFVAHPLLKELIVSALPSFESKIHVVGLPFSSAHVLKQVDKEWSPDSPVDVVYSSRFDAEKNPHLFLEVVDRCRDAKFAICTGNAELRGTAEAAVARALELAKRKHSNLRIYTGMTKGRYYKLLLNSKIQVNTSWQDWVSFTLLEALTFRCTPLYPCHRSFPSTLDYNNDWLYVPDDSLDLSNRIMDLLSRPPTPNIHNGLKTGIVNFHDGALNRIAGLMC